ncbi:hypothetical protein CDD81_5207 [Ophiocordyceps australis]|uniref:Arrestin-like N-terminal domain-containing protein n=1 Tax=Ophiocordyceps australis TaxID=1399860 RepID=A0A2C5X6W1_9HYPO|nr:hypothetical protein CDD81_5207 [Ophiocordyceps australis]
MSIRIALDSRPEFYTNLDQVRGRVVLGLTRSEQVGSIVVKLEGESITALQVPGLHEGDRGVYIRPPGPLPGPPGSVVAENHKILYRYQQVFPDDYHSSSSNPYGAFPLQPGEHEFPFSFKLPINNACSDALAMSRIGGLGPGPGGMGGGTGLFGLGGIRVMDGSKQLFLKHITRTLPPSLTGYPMEAEIRYYIKVTVQRPGLLKENWRYQIGFKFLPIEPPRPSITGQEAFARRPFAFRPKSPQQLGKKRSGFFSRKSDKGGSASAPMPSPTTDAAGSLMPAPSIEMSARLPHPPVLTCNKPVPLRLIAKKLVKSPEQVYLVSFELNLIGITELRSHNVYTKKMNRWVVVANSSLCLPLASSGPEEAGQEFVVPDDLWSNKPLPNTVAPSFVTCNISRRYELEVRLGLSWGRPSKAGLLPLGGSGNQPQVILLPLHFGQIEVFSGIAPPPELAAAARNPRPGLEAATKPPRLPPRTSAARPNAASRPSQAQGQRPPAAQAPYDPLYPPQLGPGQTTAPEDDAPPSYDEAMAENMSGPFDGMRPRPAYSGVTNENGPSQMPEKA